MTSKAQIIEMIRSKGKGKSIHITTPEYSYWGRLFEYKDETITLKPFYSNRENDLRIHDDEKQVLLIDNIIDVD